MALDSSPPQTLVTTPIAKLPAAWQQTSAQPTGFFLDLAAQTITPMSARDASTSHLTDLQGIIARLQDQYPLVAVDNELGEPRLAGTRIAVANVLTGVINFGSVDELFDEYEGRYTKEQLTEALKFSRDFVNSFFRYADHT